MLQAYFKSGWAFLIPYLAFYLLYAAARWPVNPSALASTEHKPWSWIPCLLYVYWFLHLLHLILATVTLRAWWIGSGLRAASPSDERKKPAIHPLATLPSTAPSISARCLAATAPRSATDRLLSITYSLLPWILLGLLFYIPGVYLEWPSDTWEHYARITRWKAILSMMHGDVGSFYKPSFYFLAYSFLGQLAVDWQLKALGIYEAIIALLISWQFYRLAREVGLGAPPAFMFVLIQALTFGNDIFGFYRYYGLSSSTFAVLGAIASVRIAIEISHYSSAKRCKNEAGSIPSNSLHIWSLGLSLLLSLVLASLNHIQGLAIAGLGCLAVVVWHGIKFHPKATGIAFGLFIVANIAFVFLFPRHPLVDTVFRTQAWLNAWFGFDVFSSNSNASRRIIVILGAVGLANIIAGIFLIGRNSLAGWLTITPLLALEFPIFSLPFANYLAAVSPSAVLAFHRVIFAIPPGLALISFGVQLLEYRFPYGPIIALRNKHLPNRSPRFYIRRSDFFLCLLVGVCLLSMVIPTPYPYCNRLWNVLAVTPADLEMKPILSDFYRDPTNQTTNNDKPILVVASSGVSLALQSYSPFETLFTSQERLIHGPPPRAPSLDFGRIEKTELQTFPKNQVIYYWPKPSSLFTPQSYAGFLSQHWNPSEVALAYTRK